MTGWVTIDDDVVFDSTMQALPGEVLKTWINVLCVASKNGGRLPILKEVAFALRMMETAAIEALDNLRRLGRLVESEDGTLRPRYWIGEQFIAGQGEDNP